MADVDRELVSGAPDEVVDGAMYARDLTLSRPEAGWGKIVVVVYPDGSIWRDPEHFDKHYNRRNHPAIWENEWANENK